MPVDSIGPSVSGAYFRDAAFSPETETSKQTVNLKIVADKKVNPKQPADESVFEAIAKANRLPINQNTEIHFAVHEKTKEIMVKIVDVQTQEVIKEIPPEKILDLVGKIMEMAGLIVDERR